MNELPSVNTREASTDRPPRIPVVEDEAPLGELLSYNLKAEGFEAEHIDRGDEAELCLAETPFDPSFSIGCCREYRVLRSVAAFGRVTTLATCHSSC